MKLTLKPVEIPFEVDDEVCINQPYGSLNQGYSGDDSRVYFPARIIRIFWNFRTRLASSRNVKPFTTWKSRRLLTTSSRLVRWKARVALHVDLEATEQHVFASEEDLLAYQSDAP